MTGDDGEKPPHDSDSAGNGDAFGDSQVPGSAPSPESPPGGQELSDEDLSVIGSFKRSRAVPPPDAIFGSDEKAGESPADTLLNPPKDPEDPAEPSEDSLAKPDFKPLWAKDDEADPEDEEIEDPFASLDELFGGADSSDAAASNSAKANEDFLSETPTTDLPHGETFGEDETFSVGTESELEAPALDPFGGDSDQEAPPSENEDAQDFTRSDPFGLEEEESFSIEAPSVKGDAFSGAGTSAKLRQRVGTGAFQKEVAPAVGKGMQRLVAFFAVLMLTGVGAEFFTPFGWFFIEYFLPPPAEMVQAEVLPAPPPKRKNSAKDTASGYLGDIRNLQLSATANAADIQARKALLNSMLEFSVRFPEAWEIHKPNFTHDIDMLLKQIDLSGSPRLRALDALRKGEAATAQEAIAQALTMEPDDSAVHYAAGLVAVMNEDSEAALREFIRSAELDPLRTSALHMQGVVHQRSGDLALAKERYMEVLRRIPAHNDARLALVEIQLQEDKLEEARNLCEEALSMGRIEADTYDIYRAHRVLARIAGFEGDADRRLEHLEAALLIRPTNIELLSEVADQYMLKGKPNRVDEFLTRAYDTGSRDPILYRRMVHNYISLNVERARILANEAAREHPENSEMLFLVGEVAEANGDNRKAEAKFEQALALNSGAENIWIRLANVVRKERGLEAAGARLEEALTRLPSGTQIRLALAGIHAENGRLDEALGIYEKLLEDFPEGTIATLCVPGNPLSEQDTTCDNVDDDCDGEVDEEHSGELTSCGSQGACASTGRKSCVNGAINDTCEAAAPAADDATCDGIDDDCDGHTDEDHVAVEHTCGHGPCASAGTATCSQGELQIVCTPKEPTTSDDSTCDGIDDDCDGQMDEDHVGEKTTCGEHAPCIAHGEKSCVDGKETDNCTVPDPAETDATCDGIDDDCDGVTDEDFIIAKSECGLGACAATGEVTCVAGTSTDTCVAGNPPESTDTICDGVDSDCDGEVDEDFPAEPTTCSNESTCRGSGQKLCQQGQIVDNCTVPAPAENDATCDGRDDDCDGRVDEDYVPPTITCGAGPCLKQGAATCTEGQVVETCVPAEPQVTTDNQCNGIDDDCDGVVDDDFVGTATRCGTTGACRGEGAMLCKDGQIIDSCVAPEAARSDTSCNGIDDDCDGEIDEDFSPEVVNCGQGACKETGITSCPRTRDTRLARALLLTRMGRSTDAITEFGKLNSWDLESESVAVAYAQSLARAGQPRRALAHLQTLLKSKPQSIAGNTHIGELHVERQAYALAEDYLQTALRVAPYHAPAHHALGRIARHRDQLPQAIKHFRTALGFDAENVENHISLGAALMDSRGEKQVEEAEQVLDLVIQRYGRLQGAAALQREPDVYLRRGRLHHDRGQFPDAMRNYSLSLELDSKNLAALSGAGETLLKLNRVAEGEAMFRRVLKEDGTDTRSHYHLGRISHRRGEIAKAEAHLRKATAREEASFADAHKTLGLLHKERKEAIPARAHLRAYLKLSRHIGDEEREEITRIMNRLR